MSIDTGCLPGMICGWTVSAQRIDFLGDSLKMPRINTDCISAEMIR